MEFNIGDRVKVNNEHAENHGMVGTVADKLFSSGHRKYLYTIKFDNSIRTSSVFYDDVSLEHYESLEKLYYDFEVAGNVVIARLIDDHGNELQRGHGHIIHEGIKGFTQAASYALKKIFEKYNDGQL